MSEVHEQYMERAKKAINDVFDDQSITQTETWESLQQLIGEIEMLQEALDLE